MSASAIRAGAAYIELTLRKGAFTKGLQAASTQLKNIGKSLTNFGTRMLAVGTAIAAPLVAAAQQFAGVGDQFDKMSLRTQTSVDALSELAFAAEQTGASAEALEKGLTKMSRTIGDAANGSTAAQESLQRLGLSVQDLVGLSPDQQMAKIADAIQGIQEPALRTAAIMEVFGKSGQLLAPLLATGAAGIAELREEARRLGISLSGEEATQAAAYTDELNRLSKTMRGLSVAIGSAVVPVLQQASEWVRAAVANVVKFIKENKELVASVLKVGAVVGAVGGVILTLGLVSTAVGFALGGLVSVLGLVASGVGMVGAALAAIMSPVGLVIAGVAAIAGGFLYMSGVGGAAIEWLSQQFGVLKDDALAAWKGIGDALAAGNIALAAKILWLTLKLEWQRGVDELNKIWVSAKTYALEIWDGVTAGILTLWNDAWALVESGFVDTIGTMSSVLDNFLGGLQKKWGAVTDFIANKLLWVQGQFDSTLDVAAAQKELADMGTRRNAGIDENIQARATAREAGLTPGQRQMLKDIEDRRQRANENVATSSAETAANRTTTFDSELAATEAAVKATKELLTAAIGEAAAGVQPDPNGPAPAGLPKGWFDGSLDAAGKTIADEAESLEGKGTFSALAAGRLGADSIGERTAKATEAVAENTRRLLNEAKRVPVFGA
jgi:TP901 family phage tail tape measure protein